MKKSDHYDGVEFFNPVGKSKKNFSDLMKWQRTRTPARWPKKVDNTHKPKLAYLLDPDRVSLTYINHSTFLIQLPLSEEKVINILTDPVFSERTSPMQFIGPKRVRPPGLRIDELPHIDLVLVSHNHYDHMDMPALKSLVKRFDPLIITPLENKKFFPKSFQNKIIEHDWWDTHEIHTLKLKVHTTPAHHWSRRTLSDTNKALWGGFVIETAAKKIFFAGDTGYQDHFKKIQQRFSKIDLALLPIGAFEPRWFMKEAHMNPEDAVQAHIDLCSSQSLGMHFGTFQLTDEAIDDPIKELYLAKKKYNIESFDVLGVGESKVF